MFSVTWNMGMNIDFHDGPSCHLSKRFILWKPKLEVFSSILLAMEIPPSMENVPFMEFKHKICLSCRLPPPPPPIMSHPFLDPMIVGELQHKHKLFCHLFLRWLQAARKPGVAETIMGKMFSKHICKNATTEYGFCALIDTSNVSTSCFYHPNFPFCALIDTSNVSTSCFYHPNFPILSVETSCGKSFFWFSSASKKLASDWQSLPWCPAREHPESSQILQIPTWVCDLCAWSCCNLTRKIKPSIT